MQKKFIALIVVLALFCSFVLPTSAITGGSISADDSATLKEEKSISTATLEDEFADDHVIVLLSNAASTSLRSYTTADFSEFGCSEVNNLTQYTTELVNATLSGDTSVAQQAMANAAAQNIIVPEGFYDLDTAKYHQILCLTLEEKGKQNVLDTIAEVIKHPDVIYAGPDYVIRACATTPNDPYRSDQWAINKIKLPQAWDVTTGSATVLVGVIDTGIDGTHPDLRNRINTSLSRDFTSNEIQPVTSVTDPNGHGTLVAGIIGAAADNGQGVSGTCYDVTMVSLRALGADGNGYVSHAYRAKDYANSIGIPILNMSFGWGETGSTQYDAALQSVLDAFPGLIVCAAGNDNNNLNTNPNYPAAFNIDNLITVGASTSLDQKLYGSNYSTTAVDLLAPGAGILSCYPVAKCQSYTDDDPSTQHYYGGSDVGYHYADGTSMSAAYVTGVAALILAKYPTLSATQIKTRILEGVDYISGLSTYCSTSGRLNAYKAVHNHSYTYTQYTGSTHYKDCSCGLSTTEEHIWVVYGSNGYRCSKCGYISYAQLNSVPDESTQE